MAESLLKTKFYLPPISPNHVKRPRLLAKISDSFHKPLTILVAPAGYGKTTLISEWHDSHIQESRLVWLSLDHGDNDLVRFLLYLSGAVERTHPEILKSTHLLLDSRVPQTKLICTTLINDLAEFDSELLLVLDNYHLIEDGEIHRAVEFLVEHLPPRIHLVLLSRADPPLPLARLRAGGKLSELRAADLRFSHSEASSFLNQMMKLGLSPEDIDSLLERTEGWIAGLQLAALSLMDRADKGEFISYFSGSNRYILDYLIEEVLNHLSMDQREFLLKTSLLDRLTGSLCDALLGRNDSQEILLDLCHANLFIIPLDSEGKWFRYHHLFSDLLRRQLAGLPLNEINQLRHQAGSWYDEHDLAVEAIDQAFLSADFAWATDLLKKHFQILGLVEYHHRVLEWFAAIPAELLQDDPWLSLHYAKLLLDQQETEKVHKYLDFAQIVLEREITRNPRLKNDRTHLTLQADLYAIKAWMAARRGKFEPALDFASHALAIAPKSAASIKATAYNVMQLVYRDEGDIEKALDACRVGLPESLVSDQVGLIVSTYNIYGGLLLIQGQLRDAAEIYKEALAKGEKREDKGVVGFSLIRLRLADIYYQWNRIDEAEKMIWQALERVNLGDDLFGMVYGRYLLMLIYFARGEFLKLNEIWQEISQILPRTKGAYYARELQRLLELSKIRMGLEDASDVEIPPPDLSLTEEPPSREFEIRLLEARFALEKKQLENLGEFLAVLETAAAQRGHLYWLIQIHIQQALLNLREGKRDRARDFLLKSLYLGEDQGFMRVFLDEGDQLRDLLRYTRSKMNEPGLLAYASKLAAAFLVEKPEGMTAGQPLIEPLTERELEVLSLLADGHSNQEIAQALVISLGTVKRHTGNIYQKLDAKNRTEAVAISRQLGMLS